MQIQKIPQTENDLIIILSPEKAHDSHMTLSFTGGIQVY